MHGRNKFIQNIGKETSGKWLRRGLVEVIDTDIREMEFQDMNWICLVHSFH
jgi:hypothetical protein